MTLQDAKNKLENNFGSIYSKQDVLELLNTLEFPKAEITITVDDLEELKNKISKSINNIDVSDIVDFNSAEFSIGYNNQLTLEDIEIDNSYIETAINDQLDLFIEQFQSNETDEQ